MRMHLQTIAWRQAANASHWGGSMLEWAPRNLQSSLLLTPYHATFAEHVGARAPHTAEASAKRACFAAFDDSARPHHTGRYDVGRPVGAARVALLRRVLRGFDLVGLLERFDETLLLLADLTGLQRLLAPRRRPPSTGPHDSQPPSAEQICPDRAACAAAIAARAPVDSMIYAEASRAFDATVAAQGAGFGRRLSRLRRARRAWRAERRRERRHERRPSGHERTREDARGHAHALVVPRARQQVHEVTGAGLRCALWNGEPASLPAPPPTSLPAPPAAEARGNEAVAHDLCRHIAAETPFDLGARYTPAACCAKLLACSGRGGGCGACGVGCEAWQRAWQQSRARAALAPAELNASICAIGCAPAVHGEWERRVLEGAGLRYEAATSPVPPPPRRASHACEDTAWRAAWKPWSDFASCEDEARASQAGPRAEAPCASKPWLRVNCRASCGLCALNLTHLLRQPTA